MPAWAEGDAQKKRSWHGRVHPSTRTLVSKEQAETTGGKDITTPHTASPTEEPGGHPTGLPRWPWGRFCWVCPSQVGPSLRTGPALMGQTQLPVHTGSQWDASLGSGGQGAVGLVWPHKHHTRMRVCQGKTRWNCTSELGRGWGQSAERREDGTSSRYTANLQVENNQTQICRVSALPLGPNKMIC